MSDPKPSDEFLFFQPSWGMERLYVPGFAVLFVASLVYAQVGLTYALFLSPLAYKFATGSVLVASSAITLLALNVYWAYEGNLTRRQKRPHKKFNNGSKYWCAFRHCFVAFICFVPLSIHFHEAIPHALLDSMGKPVIHELVVEKKIELNSRYRRNCRNPLVAHSLDYRSDNLCLDSNELYAEVNVGDTLIVEGKANWIGLLVDKPIALRDADSGLERSVQRPSDQVSLAQVDATRKAPPELIN